jgi:EAL and modified HD-GYP domain-containing signal transduction protein
MTDFLIGRQQIFDRDLRIFGYELLFRTLDDRSAPAADGSAITQQLIVDAILELGLEKLTGGTRAFINFTADNLLDGIAELLPKDRVVIEVLESARITPHLISSVRRLAAAGYLIALDDFVFEPAWEPLVQIAHIIKIDVRAQPENETYELIHQLKPYGTKILLEKIESEQEFQLYHRLGGDYFQGYFLHRPHLQAGKRIEAVHQTLLQLLAELHQPTIDFYRIAELVRRDPALSFKLLNFTNSAWFALPRRIDSIEQAVILLGLEQIKRWATLLALSSAVQTQPTELLRAALTRARMCELLAIATEHPAPHQAFLVGLFSNLDALLGVPLAEITKTLPLAEEVQAGLNQQGPLGEILSCTLNYERWQLTVACCSGLSLTTIGRIYLDSIAWAQQAYSCLHP